MLRRIGSLLRALTRRRRFEEDMTDEVRFHIDQYAADLARAGMPPAEAARRARIAFGSLDNVKDDCRQARGLRLFDELSRDVRYAVRLMRKTPAFTATALATLAICLGANLTIFAVVDAILLRPLPFPDSDRLVRVFNTYPKAGVLDDGCSVANYYERRGQIAAFTTLAAYREGTAIVGDAGATEREYVTRVTPDFFATLGRGPVMGRAFTDAEMTWQTDRVVILTDAWWRQRLNADPHAVGRTIRIDGSERTVVGILPPEFRVLSSKARLYVPYSSNVEDRASQRRHWGSSSQMIARLAPGAGLPEAQSQVDTHNVAMETRNPDAKGMADAGFRTMVVSLHGDHVAAIRPMLLLVQTGALVLLLIGTVNLVNLLLVRASGRLKEIAVRQAIGASRRHVVSAVLADATVLTLIGGLLGLAVGAGGIRLMAALGTDRLPLGANVAFDARLAAAALIGAIVTGLAIGVPIAWYCLRSHGASALQSESRSGTASRAAQRLRHAFLVAQMSLAFTLLSGAGLLAFSLEKAMAIAPGFRAENVLTGRVSLPGGSYRTRAAYLAFVDRLTGDLGRHPGVTAVGVVTNVPMSDITIKAAATVKGHRRQPGEPPRGIYSYGVGGDYFTAMGLTVVEGRFLEAADSRRTERVCVIDEDFARRYFPRGNALGQRVFQGSQEQQDTDAFTIVGVVRALKQAGLTDEGAQGAVFYPFGYRLDSHMFVVARTTRAPDSLAAVLPRVVRAIDPELPVSDLQSMEARIADSLVARRSPALLAGLFSAIAVLLTAIGTYGVLSVAVAQRRREIGLRMALGARPAQVRGQFVRLAVRLLVAGTLFGAIGAWMTGQAMQTLLFQVPAFHLTTLVATAGLMGVVSLAACLLPSRRAARISPMEALADQ